MSREVPDQAERDRFLADRDRSFFLKAGAGAGKSTSLVERIMQTIADPASGVSISDIVAITFTNRAAADLTHKLRAELVKKAGDGPADPYARALRQLDTAHVGTIHSFAGAILKRFALEAGLPPGFEVATESESAVALRSRARAVVESLPNLATIENVLGRYGIPMGGVVAAIENLDLVSGRAKVDACARAAAQDAQQAEEARLALAIAIDEIVALCRNDEDRLMQVIAGHRATIASLLEMDIDQLCAYWRAEDPSASKISLMVLGNVGSKDNWDLPPKEVRAMWGELEPHVVALVTGPMRAAIWELLEHAVAQLDLAREERRAAGELEFDDLLLLARDLVLRDASVRATLHADHKLILVDEFQDTDPVQWQLVHAIASGADESGPTPGSTVVVGDAKQAIYSFRGADVRTYEAVEREFATGAGGGYGNQASLTTNFRSQRPIVEWVNEVFQAAMAADDSQVDYTAMEWYRDDKLAGPPVTILNDPTDANEMSSAQVEAALVAQTITTAIADKWQVMSTTKEVRDCRLSDIAVLYPTRTTLNTLLNELDRARIPYRSSDARLVFDRPVVSGAAHLLRVLAEPGNSASLWWALKSPLYGHSDAELLEFKERGGYWSGPIAQDLADLPVAKSLTHIESLTRAARLCSPAELLNTVCADTRIWESLSFAARGQFDADCLRMLIRFALQWEAEGNVGLEAFVTELDAMREPNSRATLPAPDDREDDAIQLLTIFGAKGLEFNIAIVAGMTSRPKPDSPKVIVGNDGGVHFRISKLLYSGGYAAVKNTEFDTQKIAERMRVLYVGCTRARDHLVVSLCGDSTKGSGSHSDTLSEFVPEGYRVKEWRKAPTPVRTTLDIEALPAQWPRTVADLRVASARPAVALPSGAGALALGLSDGSHDDVAQDPTIGDSVASYVAVVRDGADFGQCVHKAMDAVIRSGMIPLLDEARSLVERAAIDLGVNIDAQKAAVAVTALAATDIVREALASPRRWPELQMAAPVDFEGAVLVEGFADLVFEGADGALVLCDYKTDGDISVETMAHYKAQLGAYAEILHRATGSQVSRKYVLHVSSGVATVKPV